MLHVRQEDVPHHRDRVNVEHPVLGRDKGEVDVLSGGPDHPVKLKSKGKVEFQM